MDADSQQPFFNMDAEQSLLGAILLDNQAFDRVSDIINERDFYTLDHIEIYRAMNVMLASGKPVDIVTVAEQLDSVKLLEKVGGIAYLAQLAQNTPGAGNITNYAQIVRDRSLMRGLSQVATDIQEKIKNRNGMNAKDLLDFAQSRFMTVGEAVSKQSNTVRHVSAVMDDVLADIDRLAERGLEDDVTGLRSGLQDLDKLTTGFQPGELYIIAARPSMGKTSLALQIIEQVGMRDKKNVVAFSLEMINGQLGLRMLSSRSKINTQRVRVGRMNASEMSDMLQAANDIRNSTVYLDDAPNLGITDLRAKCRRLHRECAGGLHMVVIDYLQLMTLDGDDENRANALGKISRGLKLLAKELQVPVIALSQLNRGLEQRPNKRPIMSDLRDSGAIEQDADAIIFIYRDEVYHPDSPDAGTAELILGKQRNGPTGTVRVTWIGHLTRFENFAGMQYQQDEPPPERKNFGGNFRQKNDFKQYVKRYEGQ